jgi:hypothetical protein
MGVDPQVCQAAGASAPVVLGVVESKLCGARFDIEGKFDYTVATPPAENL